MNIWIIYEIVKMLNVESQGLILILIQLDLILINLGMFQL